jgi:hypothetical protein
MAFDRPAAKDELAIRSISVVDGIGVTVSVE